jgi:endonuclease/exonuclease/phosphatase (EEP) superfamily protein YafD
LIEEALVELAGAHPYLRVAIEVEGRPLTILAAHVPVNFGPGAPDAPARRDIGVVAEMAVAARPAILLGDFNFTDQNVEYQVLTRAGLRDAFRVAGWGLGSTFPLRSRTGEKRVLLYRIDMVLVTEDLCVKRAWMGADGGSDHRPALATVRW